MNKDEHKPQKGTYYPAKCPRCKDVMASYMGGEIYTCSNCNEDNGVELQRESMREVKE